MDFSIKVFIFYRITSFNWDNQILDPFLITRLGALRIAMDFLVVSFFIVISSMPL
jgi:hypothetical protein